MDAIRRVFKIQNRVAPITSAITTKLTKKAIPCVKVTSKNPLLPNYSEVRKINKKLRESHKEKDSEKRKKTYSEFIEILKSSFADKAYKQLEKKSLTPVKAVTFTPKIVRQKKSLPFLLFDSALVRINPKLKDEVQKKVKKIDVVRITSNIRDILSNPNIVLECLKDLDKELGSKLAEQHIDIADNSPQYYVTNGIITIPGPAPTGYMPAKKGRILSKSLLAREREDGINEQGVALFTDFVENSKANDFVARGNIFSEDEQLKNMIIHGKHSHRLQFEIIRQAVKKGFLKLELSSGESLTTKELLAVLVRTRLFNSNLSSMWEECLDSFDFYGLSFNKSSSVAPHSLKSIICLFGDEAIPNLRKCVLDSHYKQMAKITAKAKDLVTTHHDITREIDDDTITRYCAEYMASHLAKLRSPGGISIMPFSEYQSHVVGARYEKFPETESGKILRKKTIVADLEVVDLDGEPTTEQDRKDDAPATHSSTDTKPGESLAAYASKKIAEEKRRGDRMLPPPRLP